MTKIETLIKYFVIIIPLFQATVAVHKLKYVKHLSVCTAKHDKYTTQ